MDELNFSENVSDSYSQGSSEIPMSSPQVQEYEYQALGRTIKEPIDQILKRASQGYDYAQKMQDYNNKLNEFNTNYKTYQEIDNYARSNPQWWEHIQSQYNALGNPTNNLSQNSINSSYGNGYASPSQDPYAEKFQKIESFMNDFIAEKKQKEREQADQALNQEIDDIRKQYSTIDFNQLDDNGKSLEKRILEHAVNTGIKSFKTAFRDFYHEELVKRAELEGKSRAAQEMQKNSKLGLLGRTEAPTKELSTPNNIRSHSYNDLTQLALKEMGY